jgi:hypothetical protein
MTRDMKPVATEVQNASRVLTPDEVQRVGGAMTQNELEDWIRGFPSPQPRPGPGDHHKAPEGSLL